MIKRFIVALAGALYLTAALPVAAQQINQPASTDSSARAIELTTSQRSQVAESIIARWSGPVMKSPGGDVKRWSSKLRQVIATAASANVVRASQMPSLPLVHAALTGARIDDATMREAFSGTQSTSGPEVLGSYSTDTTYTPLPNGRCRIASSLAIISPLSAGVERGLEIEDVSSYSSQGGTGSLAGNSSAFCGIPNFATAYAVSVSARNPVADGVLKVFPFYYPNSTGNTIFFSTAANGAGSDLIVKSCQGCGVEIALLSTVQTHYIVDVVGYFMPPVATPLSCTSTAENTHTATTGNYMDLYAPACPSGYTPVSTRCNASNYGVFLTRQSDGRCIATNQSGNTASLAASQKCCQIPGR